MTKKKLVTLAVKAQWEHIVRECIKSIHLEPPRTDNTGQRSKIRVTFPVNYKFGKPFPKFMRIPCDDPDMITREWCCHTLLDWAAKWGLSDYGSHAVYAQRRGVLKSLDWLCKEIGLDNVEEAL